MGERLVLPPLFASDLAQTWAQLPARTTTERVWGMAKDITLTVHAPRGVVAPPDVSLSSPGGARYERVAEEQDGALVVKRQTFVPRMLVPASDYSGFATFCRRVTEADRQEITVGL